MAEAIATQKTEDSTGIEKAFFMAKL